MADLTSPPGQIVPASRLGRNCGAESPCIQREI